MNTNEPNVLLRPLSGEYLLVAAKMAGSTSGRSPDDLLKIYERDLSRTDRVAQVGAFVNDELVGFGRIVWVEFEESQVNQAPSGWYLLGVNVLPTHRRRGIATLLTNWRIDWLADRAKQLFYVAIPTNVASIQLHEALGFVKVQENVFMPPGLDGLTLFGRGVARRDGWNHRVQPQMLASASSYPHREAIKYWLDGVPVYSTPRFGAKTSMKRSVV